MIPRGLQNRLRSLTDALIRHEGVESAFLASVLLAAADSVRDAEIAAFALRVWRANNGPRDGADASSLPATKTTTTTRRPSRRRQAG